MAKQPNTETAAQLLNKIGIDEICNRIGSGESQAEICRSLEICASSLTEWLLADNERSARAKVARSLSAESWMDKGWDCTDIPKDATSAEIAQMRERRQHCLKMAAIRNPQYSEKLTLAGDAENPLAVITKIERTVVKTSG